MRAALVIALVAVSLAACKDGRARRDPLPPGEAAQLLAERVWLDHAPRTPRDKFHLAIFADQGFAIAQHRTAWKGDFEVFRWKLKDDQLELVLPGSNKRATTGFRIERLAGGHRDPDLRLILDENPVGPREYKGYSMERGGAVSVEAADAWLRTVAPAAQP